MNNISETKLEHRKHTQDKLGRSAKMLSAPDQCEHMQFLVKIANAKKGIEVGSFTGYSALCFAAALPADGKLICMDIKSEWFDIGRPYLEKAGVADKCELRVGPAVESLDKMLATEGEEGTYDFAYIDADKV